MKHRDYHEYVIKDGVLVGRFEDMYRDCSDIPWNQDKTAFGIFSDIDLLILGNFQKRFGYNSILEIGCGLGYFANRLKSELAAETSVTGIDISSTAINKAHKLHKGMEFLTADIINDDPEKLKNRFDLVIAKEIIWYVMDSIDSFFNNLRNISKQYVYFSQCFPESDNYLGQNIFPDSQSLIKRLSEEFEIIYAVTESDRDYHYRDLIHVLSEVRK